MLAKNATENLFSYSSSFYSCQMLTGSVAF